MKHLTAVLSVWLLSQSAVVHADEATTRVRTPRASAVFTVSNEANANHVLSFAIAPDGSLSEARSFDTGGKGSGDSLGSQAALVLSEDHAFLIAVNAGSNELSSFAVHGGELSLRDRVSSAGLRPISVTERHGLVYVLNAGTPNTIAGFSLDPRGRLTPLCNAAIDLGASDTGPAQIELNPEGSVLIVSEKTANKLVAFRVGAFGGLSTPRVIDSAGMTPFGFEFSKHDRLIVSEAATNSLSSYDVTRSGNLKTLSAAVPDTQAAPCWVAISPDDRFAFTANAGSASISSYAIDAAGHIQLEDARAGELAEGGRPLDLAFAQHGRYLYVLDRGRAAISGFAASAEGQLTAATSAEGLPAFASGLAAY